MRAKPDADGEANADVARRRIVFVAANPSVDRLYEVDKLSAGDIHRPSRVTVVPGGKGLNAARAARRLGGLVAVAGIFAGQAGEWLVDNLRDAGIDTNAIWTRGESRTCISILDRAGGGLTEIYEFGGTIAEEPWLALEAAVAEEVRQPIVGALAMSGSLPLGAPRDGYARLVRLATHNQALPVLVDAAGSAFDSVLPARPTVARLNASEASEWSHVDVYDAKTAVIAASTICDAGARTAIITLGPSGAVLVSDTMRMFLRPPQGIGPYPVGSGDAFLGGVAVGLARGDAMEDAARLGMAAAIANAHAPGAGDFDESTIEAHYSAVAVSPI
jgi:1-phosphofructokinase family hexose kinase